MKILVVVSACLKVNSSANLCHRAYIEGLVDSGNEVLVVDMSGLGQIIDSSIELPQGAKYISFDSSFLLKYINPSNRKNLSDDMENGKTSLKTKIFTFMRQKILDTYGIHGYFQAWINNVVRGYKGEKNFDCIISLSSPVSSHEAAYQLIRRNKVKAKQYIQIWEDPWQYDIYKEVIDKEKLAIEEKITTYADRIIYVSPLTLKIQKDVFNKTASKMEWCPLPYYYKDEHLKPIRKSNKVYGYFGDYFPHTRNLEPFYQAAKEQQVEVNICGMPFTLFKTTDTIHIHERLPLNKLKTFEDKTDVLVFVCNLKGGQIPGKIYQYSSTNRYILFILDGSDSEKEVIKSYFGKFDRYVFCDNNVEDIKKALVKIENDECTVRNECVDYFSPSNIAQQILTHE